MLNFQGQLNGAAQRSTALAGTALHGVEGAGKCNLAACHHAKPVRSEHAAAFGGFLSFSAHTGSRPGRWYGFFTGDMSAEGGGSEYVAWLSFLYACNAACL